ncbi:TPA: hypothetical protein ACH3X2_000258 [Trebouxia sp. C0005]
MDPPASSGDAEFDDIVGPDHMQDHLHDVEDDETPSNRGVKRLRSQHQAKSSGSSTGRPTGTLWSFFDKSATKQNSAHHTAFCKGCRVVGQQIGVTGKSDSMKAHLQERDNVSDKVRSPAGPRPKTGPRPVSHLQTRHRGGHEHFWSDM